MADLRARVGERASSHPGPARRAGTSGAVAEVDDARTTSPWASRRIATPARLARAFISTARWPGECIQALTIWRGAEAARPRARVSPVQWRLQARSGHAAGCGAGAGRSGRGASPSARPVRPDSSGRPGAASGRCAPAPVDLGDDPVLVLVGVGRRVDRRVRLRDPPDRGLGRSRRGREAMAVAASADATRTSSCMGPPEICGRRPLCSGQLQGSFNRNFKDPSSSWGVQSLDRPERHGPR